MRRVVVFVLLILLSGCVPVEGKLPTSGMKSEIQVWKDSGKPPAGPPSLVEIALQQTAAADENRDANDSLPQSGSQDAAQESAPTTADWTPSDQGAAAAASTATSCSPGQARFNALLIRNRIILDGDVDAWYASFHEASNVVSGAEQWAGDWDLSATFQTGWTSEALYVVVRVTDERYVQAAEEPDDVQEGDSIDLLLDADLCGDWADSEMNSDDFHLRISPGYQSTNGDRSVYRMQPSPAGVISGATVVSSRVGSVTNYEIEIPWAVLGISDPAAGQMIRFALLVNDNDDPGANLQESVLATTRAPLDDSLDPQGWALLVLRE